MLIYAYLGESCERLKDDRPNRLDAEFLPTMVTVPEILKQSLSAPVKTMLLELTTENWTAFSELGEKMATPTNSNLAGNQAYSGTLELPHEKPINLKKETPEGSGKNSKSHYEDLFDSGYVELQYE